LRPERYTILKEIEMTERKATNLAKITNVIWFKLPLVQELFLLWFQVSLFELVCFGKFQ
jgi:hypothetical protein